MKINGLIEHLFYIINCCFSLLLKLEENYESLQKYWLTIAYNFIISEHNGLFPSFFCLILYIK